MEAFIRFMAAPDQLTGPINLGNPREITIRELAELTIKLTGSRSTVVEQPLSADDPLQRCPDTTLAGEKLDWKPQVALEEGLRRTIEYFETSLSS